MSAYGDSAYGEVAYGELLDLGGPILGYLADGLTLAEAVVHAGEFANTLTDASTVTLTDATQIIFNKFINENIEVDNTIVLKTILQLIDAITLSESVSAPGVLHVYGVSSASIGEEILISFPVTISEAMELSDVNVVNKGILSAIIDLLTLSESVLTTAVLNPSVADGVTVTEDTNYAFLGALIEAVELGETVVLSRYATVTNSDDIELSESLINHIVYSIEAVVSAVVNAAVASQQDGVVALSENIEISDSDAPTQQYATFVMNPENYAVTTYSLGFTESAVFGQKFLYADSTGLYELGGTTDNGSNIVATLTTPAMDFNTSSIKQMPSVMLGTNGTDLILKVSIDGNLTSHYQINERNSGLMTKHIPLGKGPIGRYWQFTLITDENSDLDLDTFEFYPVVFKRKRNG